MKKLVRSALFHFPRVYGAATSQGRYVAYHRLGLVHEHDFRALPRLVPEAPSVVDVGGNSGQSVLSILRVLPAARIVSFEPLSANVEQLRRLAARFPGLTVEPYALSDREGDALVHWPVYNGKPMSGLASLDEREAAGWLSPRTVYGFRQGLLEVCSERIRLRTLDSYGLAPDLIKIDVQGAEELVIRGALRTIERSRPVILTERAGPDVQRLLDPLGYRPHVYRRGRLEPGSGTNVFLVAEKARI